MVPKGTHVDGAIQGAPQSLTNFLHVLSSHTLTHGAVLGPPVADCQVVVSALVGAVLDPFLFLLGLPSFMVLGVLTGNWGAANAFSEPWQLPGFIGTEGVNSREEHHLLCIRSKANK